MKREFRDMLSRGFNPFNANTQSNNNNNCLKSNKSFCKVDPVRKDIINKKRSQSQPRQFSLLDINDKFTNSKGSNLPSQFIRRTASEIENECKITQKEKEAFQEKMNKISFMNRRMLSTSMNDSKDKTMPIIKISKSTNEINPTTARQPNRNFQEPFLETRNKRLYKPYCLDNQEYQIYIRNYLKKKNNSLKPKSLDFYEEILKKETINQHKANSQSQNSISIAKASKQKNLSSDIFHLKDRDKESNFSGKNPLRYQNYQSSDIFFKKNDEVSIRKSGEKSFFKLKNGPRYTFSRESKTNWKKINLMPTLMNYSSTSYHPLNPSVKNFCSTKKEIEEKCHKLDKYFHVGNKQKSLGDFVDLIKPVSNGENFEYMKEYSNNNCAFYKRNNLCSEYYDIFGCYKNLCDKPFQKFKVIQGEL